MAYQAPQTAPVYRTSTGPPEGVDDAETTWLAVGGEEPPRSDRLGVHGIWELVLALVVVVTAVVVHQVNSDALLGAGLEAFLLLAASLGFAAVGLGWSVRAAVPNLAVGPIAFAAAAFFPEQAQGDRGFGAGVTLAGAVAVGVLLGIVVVGLQLPAWAASLALAMGLSAWIGAGRSVGLPEQVTYRAADHAVYWFIGFAVISLLGGLIGLAAPVRRAIGGFRPGGDPADRPGFTPGLAALAALVGSCGFAAAAGILMALVGRGAPVADTGFALTGLALGAVLVGGTSGYGRRAGLSGTLLGVVLISVVLRLAAEQEWRFPELGYAAVAVLVGLLVTRLVETAGRPRPVAPVEETPDWMDWEQPPGPVADFDVAAAARPGGPVVPRRP
jgi:hypothetical protein